MKVENIHNVPILSTQPNISWGEVLPNEILHNIFSFTDMTDHPRISLACRRFKEISVDHFTWYLRGLKMDQKEKDQYLLSAAKYGNLELTKGMIRAGADVNAKSCLRYTPLHEAATHGHTEVVKVLIEKGADVKAEDGDGRTPLFLMHNWPP